MLYFNMSLTSSKREKSANEHFAHRKRSASPSEDAPLHSGTALALVEPAQTAAAAPPHFPVPYGSASTALMETPSTMSCGSSAAAVPHTVAQSAGPPTL